MAVFGGLRWVIRKNPLPKVSRPSTSLSSSNPTFKNPRDSNTFREKPWTDQRVSCSRSIIGRWSNGPLLSVHKVHHCLESNFLSSIGQLCRLHTCLVESYCSSGENKQGQEEATGEEPDKRSQNCQGVPLGNLEGQRMLLQFTCKVCQTRNTKTMSKLAYTKGVVIVRCDGCDNNHLIADNLGWWPDLEEKGIRNVEDLMKAQGSSVRRAVVSAGSSLESDLNNLEIVSSQDS